ncbi:hypothetical protein BDR05DRAFT_966921 [Suillus weaverae]|nr:hypothetical protein BDR05DRAFT_966921 [Suillus weaverae]
MPVPFVRHSEVDILIVGAGPAGLWQMRVRNPKSYDMWLPFQAERGSRHEVFKFHVVPAHLLYLQN